MKANNEQLSALIDNEVVEDTLLDTLITDEQQQAQFSRYHLIGDVMRDVPVLDIDISQKVMFEINKEHVTLTTKDDHLKKVKPESNIVSFVKRFGQYAIAASVAGLVVVTSLVSSVGEKAHPGLEVLNTVPFGAATPVSLETPQQSQQAIKERNERLEALLKDHQLQLQTQP